MKVYVYVEDGFADVHCLTGQNWGAGKIYRAGSTTTEASQEESRIFLRKERRDEEDMEVVTLYFYPLDPGLVAIRSTLEVGASVEIVTKIMSCPEGGGKSFEKREKFTVPATTGWYEI